MQQKNGDQQIQVRRRKKKYFRISFLFFHLKLVDDEKIKILFEKQKKKGMSFDNFLDELDKQQVPIVKKESKNYRNEETGFVDNIKIFFFLK